MGITIKRYPLSRFEARDTTLLPAASLLSIKSPELTHLARSNLCTAGPTSPRSGGLRSGLYVCGARAPSPPLPPAAPASSASGAPMSVGRRGGSVWRNHTPSGPPGWECHAPPCPRSVPRASPTAPWGTGGSGQRGPRPSATPQQGHGRCEGRGIWWAAALTPPVLRSRKPLRGTCCYSDLRLISGFPLFLPSPWDALVLVVWVVGFLLSFRFHSGARRNVSSLEGSLPTALVGCTSPPIPALYISLCLIISCHYSKISLVF